MFRKGSLGENDIGKGNSTIREKRATSRTDCSHRESYPRSRENRSAPTRESVVLDGSSSQLHRARKAESLAHWDIRSFAEEKSSSSGFLLSKSAVEGNKPSKNSSL
ncbi:hypothetical protein AVEN_269057-1 [Araneus ventricosus]|uniref:Uncharacterized protein n=1 Tax=Araneus ventricosus TaxID=182803 RepID=A0A4Y2JIM6_ARAVE|nr:hypothetical protein AVEN_269057-1 [Araneus ventricosus]